MSSDDLFQKVALLMFGDSFTDLSYNQCAISPGPVQQTSAFAGVVPSSFWFQRTFTGLTLSAAHPLAASIEAGEDFAVEVIAYVQRNPLGGALFSNRTPGGNADGLLLALDGQGKAFVRVSSGGVLRLAIDSPNKVIFDALHTFKVHRKAGVWGLSVDGVPQRDINHMPVWNQQVPHGNKLYIGCDPYTTGFVGGINAVRMTVGDARQVGPYTPGIQPWPTYATDPNIQFGALSSSVTTRNSAVQLDANIINAATVSVAVVNGAGQPVGSGWAISAYPLLGANNFRLTGQAPSGIADYFAVVTATTGPQEGLLSKTHTYRITNTASGVLSAQQELIRSLGGAKLWLDASDATSLSLTGNQINQILNKLDSVPFVAAPNKPKPTLDESTMLLPCIRFPESSASGLQATAPVVLTDASSASTIVMVGNYVGQQLGQGAGLFQISNSDSSGMLDGTAVWGMRTNNTGVASAQAIMYDSSVRQNALASSAVFDPGQTFVVAWNTASNKADIWFNQNKLAEIELNGALSLWESVDAVIGFIGGAQSPNGSFVTLGELIALSNDLTPQDNESALEQLMSLLNKKWQVYANMPFATTPSVLSGYIGNPYAATTIITDATSVSINATGGSNWLITPTGSGVPGEHLITGQLPATPGPITMLIVTNNGSIVGTDDYVIQVQQLPATPIIQAPQNLQAQAGAGYASLLNIFNAQSVSIAASAGSGWTIGPAPEAESGNYVITGVAPNQPGSFSITIVASKLDAGSNTQVQTTAVFTVVVGASLAQELPEYPLDMTGLLPTNRIVDEQHTLTPANGIDRQLIMPIHGPYFAESISVRYTNELGQLVVASKNIDYICVGKIEHVSQLCEADVCHTVLVINPLIRGQTLITYQQLGGGFAIDAAAVTQQLYLLTQRLSFYGWGAVTGKPVFFPAASHLLDVQFDTVGFSSVVGALDAIKSSLMDYAPLDLASLANHAALTNNPHNLNSAKIGLGNVQNFSTASMAEAASGVANKYLTPKTAAHAISTHTPVAQNTVRGKFRLNLGNQAGDDLDASKPLTGAGVVALLNSPTSNALNGLFQELLDKAELAVQTTPAALTYPLWWKGVRCDNEALFVQAVRSYTGLRNLRFNRTLSVFYFPIGVTPPELNVKSSFSAAGSVASTVRTAVSLPLVMTD